MRQNGIKMVPWWRIAVFAAFALPITFFDLKEMRIPDVLSLGGIAVFVALGILVPGGSVITVAREALIGFGVFWAITIATGGKLGLGDAKYSVLIALSLGLYGWLTTIAVASVTGLAAGLMLVLRGGFPRDARIPFAPFLTLGAAVSIALQRLYPGGLLT
jgi:leader peptidase (prepilin peptidase)/N-methyltransferase